MVGIAFVVLKGSCLYLLVTLQWVLSHSKTVVQACVVLHNLCIMQGDIGHDYDPADHAEPDEGLDEPAWLHVGWSKQPPAVRAAQLQDN